MSSQEPVQQDNLDSGQWAEQNAFESTESDGSISYFFIDSDPDYFITSKQIELSLDRKFVDRFDPKTLSGSNTISNFFSRTARKTKAVKTGYFPDASLDSFRQGVEIKNMNQWSAGLYKISAGTPGHIISPVCLGVNEDNNNTDSQFFQELNFFNPIEFINAQDANKLITQVITFPIITSDTNQRENYILNGIIEPFPIRPIISHFSIYFPAEPHGIKANFSNSDSLQKKQSDLVDNTHKYLPTHQNKEPFLDASDSLTMTNDAGDTSVAVGPSMPYYSMDTNYLEPFVDIVYSRGDIFEQTRTYDNDLLAVIQKLPKLGATYLTQNEFSGRTGFVYNNSIQGIDSIAFGGMSR